MSTGEQDPLELLIKGEPASIDELESLEGLGRLVLENAPEALLRQVGYGESETGARVRFTSWESQEEPDDANVSVALYRDYKQDSAFMITFQPGEGAFFEPPDDEELVDAHRIAQDLLGTKAMDERAEFVVRHLQTMVLYLSGVRTGELSQDERDTERQNTAMSEMLARDLLKDRSAGSVYIREYAFRWDDGEQITITSQRLVSDIPGEDVQDSDIPKLQIDFDRNDFIYCYTLGQDDSRNLEVMGMSMEYALLDTEDIEALGSAVTEFRKQIALDDDPPNKDDVRMLIDKVLAAKMDDQTLEA